MVTVDDAEAGSGLPPVIERLAASPIAPMFQCFCNTTVACCRVLVYTHATAVDDGTVKEAVAPALFTVKSTD
jgi:hypothetical protein